MKIKTTLLVFFQILTSKIVSNGRWLLDTVLLGKEEGVFIVGKAQAAVKDNRLWKLLPQAVVLTKPPMYYHRRLSLFNRCLCKRCVSTDG